MPGAREAAELLHAFASDTGLMGARAARRYLWTDAFAVMTWIGLYEASREPRFLELARALIAQVHEVLAPRPLESLHPTAHGLRIGKPLAERAPHEPYDPELEWERDGQYYHYLTKWMHALQRAAAASGEERYRRWAVELAQAAHRTFAHPAGAPRALYWKMSIDLSRPLVPSMGAQDPLDGLVEAASLGLEREARELLAICLGMRWATQDPLGTGSLLVAALRLARLVHAGRKELAPLLARVEEDLAPSVAASARTIAGAAEARLPFRELGLALGLHAIEPLGQYIDVAALARFGSLAGALESFWRERDPQAHATWTAHADINAVTLAACLAPEGALGP